jgi:hypothetical protein
MRGLRLLPPALLIAFLFAATAASAQSASSGAIAGAVRDTSRVQRQNQLIEAAAGAHERTLVDVSTVPCRRLYLFRREQGLPVGPWWSGIVPQLTPIAAACLATVVLLAPRFTSSGESSARPLERSRSLYCACSSPGAGSATYEVKE